MVLQAKIVNDPELREGQYGPYILIRGKVLQNGENIVIFGKPNDPITSSKTRGEIITVNKDNKGKYKIVEGINNQRSNNGLQHISEPLERVVEDLLDDQDLPVFSDADKRRIMKYIKSQAKLLKYCHDVVIESFPEIAITDPRGARSLAVTLLISANQRISKSL